MTTNVQPTLHLFFLFLFTMIELTSAILYSFESALISRNPNYITNLGGRKGGIVVIITNILSLVGALRAAPAFITRIASHRAIPCFF